MGTAEKVYPKPLTSHANAPGPAVPVTDAAAARFEPAAEQQAFLKASVHTA